MPEWRRELAARLETLGVSPSRAADLLEELSQHLADRRSELISGGASPEDAERQALAELRAEDLVAGLARLRRLQHPAPLVLGAPRRRPLADLAQDLRYAFRTLRRAPGYTATAILTLALGVGANSAIFSVVNAALLQDLPVHEPDRLFFVLSENAGVVRSYPEYTELRDHQSVFQGLAAWGGITASLSSDGTAELAEGAIVTGNYFQVLGVVPALGRLLTPGDDRTPGAHPVVVLSHGLWQRRFAGRPDVVGREILLNGHRFTVVGVAPSGFTGAELGIRRDLFVPMMMQAVVRPPRAGYSGEMDPDLLGRRRARWLFLVGRLAPGISPARASAALAPVGTALAQAAGHPDEPYRFVVVPAAGGDPDRRGQMVPVAVLLMVVVGAVLLIACANVANLALSRAATRKREIAVRLAIGASGGRLVRQLLTESAVVAMAGGALGLGIALLILAALRAAPLPGGALAFQPGIDLPVLVFTLAVSLLAGLLFGLAPAMQARRVALVPALKAGETGPGRRRRLDLRGGLAVAQIALSLLLLVAAGLFLKSLHRTRAVQPGIDAESLLAAPLQIQLLRYTREQGVQFYRLVIEAVEALPGVESAALARVAVLEGSGRVTSLHIEGREGPEGASNVDGGGHTATGLDRVNVNVVDPGYFETLGIRPRAGRVFGPEDGPITPPVAVVNETFAHLHFPEASLRDALFHRISLAGPEGPWAEVVGVVSDTRYRTLVEPLSPIVYVPLAQHHESGMFLYVRTPGDPGALVPAIRRAVQALEPNLPLPEIYPVTEMIDRSLYAARAGTVLLAAFGALALVLSAIGVYGVMAFAVSRRTQEIGVRMALGAERGAVLRLVMRDGLRLIVAGTVLGLGAAALSSRALESFLYGVSGMDTLTFTVVTVLLASVAALACLLPARRAANVDPLVALRSE